jgi:hypothetical protein
MANANYLAEPIQPTADKLDETEVSALVGIIKDRYQQASTAKDPHERRMVEAYQNYRGVYGKDVKFRKSEKSRVFVKATKTKVLAGYGQIIDIIFGGNSFPIGVRETEVPEGADKYAHLSTQPTANVPEMAEEDTPDIPYNVGYAGDGKELGAGTTFGSLRSLFRGKKSKKEEVLTTGPAPSPEVVQVSPAKEAAENMQKLIHDQLEESSSVTEVSNAVFEQVLLGTGVIKGPFTYVKTLNKWVKNEETGEREYKPVQVKVPRIEFVSVWDAYPDPNATCKEDMLWFIHRHKFNESQMRGLMRMPLFNSEAIVSALKEGPNYVKQSFENDLHSSKEEGSGKNFSDRYEVLEYWGCMGVEQAKQVGLNVPEGAGELAEIQINAWICGNILLRVAVNPFTPARIPYHIFNYEKNPYSIFGIGVPENMADSQKVMNGHARMAIDNLALAGGMVFDIDEGALVPGQDMEIYNGKIFRRLSGQPGQSVYALKFPNTANENMMMFDKFRQLADESTGLPSYSHGQTGVQSMTRTASGMSMLLGAASLNIKTVISNLDNQLFRPLGQDFFFWNMQYHEGELPIEGDLEVRAMGTSSLMQKEVRSQRLIMFLQTAMGLPAVAPYVRATHIITELAKSLDLDPVEVINSPEEAQLAAAIIGAQRGQIPGEEANPLGQRPPGMGGPGGIPPGAPNPGVTGTGDGNIGTGPVPRPGEAEFSKDVGGPA